MGKTESDYQSKEGRIEQEAICSSQADECRLSKEIVNANEGKIGRTEEGGEALPERGSAGWNANRLEKRSIHFRTNFVGSSAMLLCWFRTNPRTSFGVRPT